MQTLSSSTVYSKENREEVLGWVSRPLMDEEGQMCHLSFIFVDDSATADDVCRLLEALCARTTTVQTLDLSAVVLTINGARRVEEMLKKNKRLGCLYLCVQQTDTRSFLAIARGYKMNNTLKQLLFTGGKPNKYDQVREAYLTACDMSGHPAFSSVKLWGSVDAPNMICELSARRLKRQMIGAVDAVPPIALCFRDVELTPKIAGILQTFIETTPGVTAVTIIDCIVDTCIFSAIAAALISSSWLKRVHISGGMVDISLDVLAVDAMFVRALRLNPAIPADSVWQYEGDEPNHYPRLKAIASAILPK